MLERLLSRVVVPCDAVDGVAEPALLVPLFIAPELAVVLPLVVVPEPVVLPLLLAVEPEPAVLLPPVVVPELVALQAPL
ncbi:MAG: hypothetical protein HY940_05650 [Gammaproteobacteria bacterium]|nr:hypothetical protein [Gammaproteobacteria bacterium]